MSCYTKPIVGSKRLFVNSSNIKDTLKGVSCPHCNSNNLTTYRRRANTNDYLTIDCEACGNKFKKDVVRNKDEYYNKEMD